MNLPKPLALAAHYAAVAGFFVACALGLYYAFAQGQTWALPAALAGAVAGVLALIGGASGTPQGGVDPVKVGGEFKGPLGTLTFVAAGVFVVGIIVSGILRGL